LESAATLQIDAPSTTVSLVDPRISRDGVPLCARHADSTTPPMGWTMNDLRSRSRSLAAVPDEGSVPTSTPPRDRRESEEQYGRRMSRRQSIAERAKQAGGTDGVDGAVVDGAEAERVAAETAGGPVQEVLPVVEDDPKFTSSRPVKKKQAAAEADDATAGSNRSSSRRNDDDGPSSRPNRRRDVADETEEPEEDRFPWHFQFDDDEPEELQASSPLLSRAFRATTG
jgi:hypothetical protein